MRQVTHSRRRLGIGIVALLLLGGGGYSAFVRSQDHAGQPSRRAGTAREAGGLLRPPLPSAEEIARLPPDGGPDFNRLIHERSPYLLQHARNPVDWYPWGPEAFAKAQRDDKPIFLSIGYSTCHWCHVMERESFESEEVARLMNDRFVSIKVDREERPDIDAVYMAAVQAMTGSGGWPMSVFLMPDGRPFWGGTYFPAEDRSILRPGFKRVLTAIADTWRISRNNLLQTAAALTAQIQAHVPAAGGVELGGATLEQGHRLCAESFDSVQGGFGNAPKFPRSHSLSFLLRYHERTGDASALAMVETTLDRMARGGIHDQVGGGFHRYSTDADWRVPHFEKMLYDQALLARTYVEAFQVTDKPRYAEIARDVLDYVLRDLTDARGGFCSAEDADSEGVEGRFYVWTHAEVATVLAAADAELFCRVYGVSKAGNFREEGAGPEGGRNILHLPRPLEEVARDLGLEPAALAERLAKLRRQLLTARERRVHPHKDDKILTDWNGLMIWALAYAGRALDDGHYTEAARRAAGFLLDEMVRDGRLLHRYRAGAASIPGFLEDHAFLVLGLLDLYEATFEVRWLRAAVGVAREMVRLFWDAKEGGFDLAGRDAEALIAHTQELYDGALPSGNSAATLALLRLGSLTMDRELAARGDACLKRFSGEINRFPMGYPFMLMALDFALGPNQEVVLAGDPGDPAIGPMRRALDARFLPRSVVALHPTGAGAAEIEALVPFLKDQVALDGKPTAYVCVDHACSLPTTEVAKLVALLAARR